VARHDMIVVGSGPGACTAAVEAAGLGCNVLLVEPERPYHAPIPPRLRQALAARLAGDLRGAGPPADGIPRPACWEELSLRAEQEARRYLESIRRRLERSKVQVERGAVRFAAPDAVQLGPSAVRRAPLVVVATGARPRRPSFFPFDDRVVCDVASAFRADVPLRSATVVGASTEGCEIASLLAALDVPVALLDRRTRLLRAMDRDVLRTFHARLQDAGVDVVLGEEIVEVAIAPHPREPHAALHLASGRVDRCDRLVVCAGRLPNVEELRLDCAGVETDPSGRIVTDEFGSTSAPGVYAIGEVSTAGADLGTELYQARVAVDHALGREPLLAEHLPRTLYTIPEMATVGLTDEACDRLGVPQASGSSPYPPVGSDLGSPVGSDLGSEEPGLLKLVVDAEGRGVLGIHIVGSRAGETLQLGVELMRRGARVDELASLLYASPGPAEAYRAAAVDAIQQLGP